MKKQMIYQCLYIHDYIHIHIHIYTYMYAFIKDQAFFVQLVYHGGYDSNLSSFCDVEDHYRFICSSSPLWLHDLILLMEEILHHLGWCYNPVNNGISTISTGDRRISNEPSTVAARGRVQWRCNVWTLNWAGQSRRGRVPRPGECPVIAWSNTFGVSNPWVSKIKYPPVKKT